MNTEKTGTEKIKHLFLNTMGNCRFTFKNGKDAIFLNGEYLTDKKEEIEELNEEIRLGHPYITIDPKRTTVDTQYADPMEALKAKIIADYETEKRAMQMGKQTVAESVSEQGPVVVGNTATVAEAMSGSNSVAGEAVASAAHTATQTGTVVATVAPVTGTAKIIAGPKS